MSSNRWLEIKLAHDAVDELCDEDRDALVEQLLIEKIARELKREREGPSCISIARAQAPEGADARPTLIRSISDPEGVPTWARQALPKVGRAKFNDR